MAPAATHPAVVPLSARRAEPLDLSTVERRGRHGASADPIADTNGPKSARPQGLQEAPTFSPSDDEFRDPMAYMRKIIPVAMQYGIVKIVPPDGWNPEFAIDTTTFHFRTRKQELNSVEGGARVKQNYLEGLKKFHKQRGVNVARLPSVDKRPLDLDELRRAVETRGGFESVCRGKKWAEIGRDLGYSGKIMSSLSTSLKNSYQRFCQPYEEYLREHKPAVYQQLQQEKGGPYTPSPTASPIKKSTQNPSPSESPVHKASAALNARLDDERVSSDAASEQVNSAPVGFTPVNSGGFTAVNAQAIKLTQRGPPPAHEHLEESKPTESPPQRSMPDTEPKETELSNGQISSLSTTNGNGSDGSDCLKRAHPDGTEPSTSTDEGEESGERRSKRIKKDAPPTVTGSQMTQPRVPASRPRSSAQSKEGDAQEPKPGDQCEGCGQVDILPSLLICDSCDAAYHKHCIESPLTAGPGRDWHCHKCLVGTGEFGFEDGEVYSLKQFQEKANRFKEDYFRRRASKDAASNGKRKVTEDDVEREFWRQVENLHDAVEVEYGADIHSTTHGSGFPTVEKNPHDVYSHDPWNLNRLPLHGESLFRHIKSDVSGMTVPWLYVGMCFSTFCWHNEDHYSYSANYQHFGATKTWYGIPSDDAEKFEDAMRKAVPELFEREPDLLFQLVTLLRPEQLRKAGVRVYALDQRAGQFVITCPQAYHAGFNHGFNFNEAVNFAPPDWEPYGEAGVHRLQEFRRQPCFSHDEMLITAAARDNTIKSARWLAPALERMSARETALRQDLVDRHRQALPNSHSCELAKEVKTTEQCCGLPFDVLDEDVPEDEYVCAFCKTYSYLSRFICKKSSKVFCLLHGGTIECCEGTAVSRLILSDGNHRVHFRMTTDTLSGIVQKVVDRAGIPEAWAEKLSKLIEDDPKPPLKSLRALVSEGERIPWDLPDLPDLKNLVDRCNEWVEEVNNYITRKQQNRRKNERAWRKTSNLARAQELEDRDKELRKIDNIHKLLRDADKLAFDCPEIETLRDLADKIKEFQQDAATILYAAKEHKIEILEEQIELGRAFNVDIPEIEIMDRMLQQQKWLAQVSEHLQKTDSLKSLSNFIQRGQDLGIAKDAPEMNHLRERKIQGEIWDQKAKELMAVEDVNFQQLDALAKQRVQLCVSPEISAEVDGVLKKQREARDQIISLYQRSKNSDLRQRPRYKEVKEVMEALSDLNSKPVGTTDLEKEQKRHEDWMRRGKKLFGKANAPLHILLAHMETVQSRNQACLELRDVPRVPVEPASRHASPDPNEEEQEVRSNNGGIPDVFCICRKPEAGMMIECEICHEWYHGKCLKIARGKVKEEDKYTCPICDHRVKIPRDAARPKLEDLQAWQDEIATLPFQPDEEECLASIIDQAMEFRQYVASLLNPVMSNPEELVNQRFYLRKVEGADILLVEETNFLRREVHKWAPIAPEAPPMVDVSLSTRKPRPTKVQKLLAQYGVSNLEDLPAHVKTPRSANNKVRKSSDGTAGNTDASPSSNAQRPTQPTQTRSHTPPGLPGQSHSKETYTPHTTQNGQLGMRMTNGQTPGSQDFQRSAFTATPLFSPQGDRRSMTPPLGPITAGMYSAPDPKVAGTISRATFSPPASAIDPALFGAGASSTPSSSSAMPNASLNNSMAPSASRIFSPVLGRGGGDDERSTEGSHFPGPGHAVSEEHKSDNRSSQEMDVDQFLN